MACSCDVDGNGSGGWVGTAAADSVGGARLRVKENVSSGSRFTRRYQLFPVNKVGTCKIVQL